MKKLFGLLGLFLAAFVVTIPQVASADDPRLMVGRVYHVEGSLLRYVSPEDDWVAVVRDAPFGMEDTFYTARHSMAELMVPNGTWIRIAGNTQIQFISLGTDFSEIDMAAGMGRFLNKDSNLVIKVTGPFGYVLVYPGSVVDYYVGENSAEIVPVKGNVTFVHSAGNARYELSSQNLSILADQYRVTYGEGGVDPDWDGWNRSRDNFWTSKSRTTGLSTQYLPPPLRHEAYVFEDNGRWERVYYEGSDRWFWRPTTVAPDWAPFTAGRWTEWYGDQTWIPSEPFGYVTHHYGNWIYTGGRWYWAPPVTTVTVGLPLLNIGFFWYPGRVSWIHSGGYIGWVPLAPRETYYSHNYWGGPYVVRVTNINITRVNIYPRNYAYARHAVIVPQHNFYTVNNYRTVRVKNITGTTIINHYQAAPVVNDTVIKHYSSMRQRHNFANIQVREKPHKSVTERIETNQRIIRQGKMEKMSAKDEQIKYIKEGKINREARIEPPKVTNYIVPSSEKNRPKSQITLHQEAVKGKLTRGMKDGNTETVKPLAKPDYSPGKPARPESDDKPGKPAPKPEGVLTPGKPAGLGPKPQVTSTAKPAPWGERQDQGPLSKSEVDYPPRPGHMSPKSEEIKTEKPEKASHRREGVTSAKTNQQALKPERVAPEKVDLAGARPGAAKPGKPRPKNKPEKIKPVDPLQGTAGAEAGQ